jgi:hypothetical protein
MVASRSNITSGFQSEISNHQSATGIFRSYPPVTPIKIYIAFSGFRRLIR